MSPLVSPLTRVPVRSNDIALMKLQRPAVLSAEVQVGRLPPAGSILPNGYPCVLSGWGRLTSASGKWEGGQGQADMEG